MTKATKLRELLRTKDLVRFMGTHNGLSARLVEQAGFEAVWQSGLEVSTSFAVPDANILTMSEYLNVAEQINDATSLPVMVDCDTGYGNSNNVIHMVKKFEATGIAAVCIEDKMFPKVNSYIPGRQELAPIAEFVGKIMAAKNAQNSKDFMVVARVEALIAGWGQEEALKRAHAYVDAGADAIFIHSKALDSREIIEFVKAWSNKAPLVICPTSYPSITEEQMKELGIKMVIYANHGIRAAIKSMKDIYGEIIKNGIVAVNDKIASMKDVFELQGMHLMKEHEKKYLVTKEKVRTIIPAAGISRQPSFADILKDTPLVMLDINGKSLLQRNVETLNSVGIQDITVIAGYKGEKIELDGIDVIKNREYDKSDIMHSIMLAENKLDEKALILFGDTLFERDIVEKLLKRDEDIVLVIDRSYKISKTRKPDVDLVKAMYDPIEGRRIINVRQDNPILKIGANIPKEEANYEFIGMALFSKKGLRVLKDEYKKLVFESSNADKLNFNYMIQYLIDKGYKISSMEINAGWTEIHNFEDYKNACRLMAEEHSHLREK